MSRRQLFSMTNPSVIRLSQRSHRLRILGCLAMSMPLLISLTACSGRSTTAPDQETRFIQPADQDTSKNSTAAVDEVDERTEAINNFINRVNESRSTSPQDAEPEFTHGTEKKLPPQDHRTTQTPRPDNRDSSQHPASTSDDQHQASKTQLENANNLAHSSQNNHDSNINNAQSTLLKLMLDKAIIKIRAGKEYQFNENELAMLKPADRDWLINYTQELAELYGAKRQANTDSNQTDNQTAVAETTDEPNQLNTAKTNHQSDARKAQEDKTSDTHADEDEVINPTERFEIDKVALCLAINGFGQYTEAPGDYFTVGKSHPILIYTELSNFQSVKDAKNLKYYTFLEQEVMLLKAKTGVIIWSEPPQALTDVSQSLRKQFFLFRHIRIAKDLPVGEYILKIRVTDTKRGQTDSMTASFNVVDTKLVNNE